MNKRFIASLKMVSYFFIPIVVLLHYVMRILLYLIDGSDIDLYIEMSSFNFYLLLIGILTFMLIMTFNKTFAVLGKIEIFTTKNLVLIFIGFYLWNKLTNYLEKVLALNNEIRINLLYIIICEIILVAYIKISSLTVKKRKS